MCFNIVCTSRRLSHCNTIVVFQIILRVVGVCYVIFSDASQKFLCCNVTVCRSQLPRGLRSWCAAARLLRLWFRIPLGAWMSVCCECCVFSGRGLCDELISRSEKSYRLWCVVMCDLETSWMRRPWTTRGLLRQKQTNIVTVDFQTLPIVMWLLPFRDYRILCTMKCNVIVM